MSVADKNKDSAPRRRKFLAALGAAGAATLAGCGSSTDTPVGEPSTKNVPAPTVDSAKRWKIITPDSQPRVVVKGSFGPFNYQAVGHVNKYEDKRLRRRIREDTFGEVDRPFAVAFSARIDIFPSEVSLASGIVANVDKEMLKDLKRSMKEFGVTNLEEKGRLVPTSTSKTFQQVVGDYKIQPVVIDGVDIPHSDKTRLKFGGGKLPIKGIVANWKSDGSILAGGGVYPAGPFRESEEIEMSDAISINISVDLNLEPTQRKRQLLEFVRGISL